MELYISLSSCYLNSTGRLAHQAGFNGVHYLVYIYQLGPQNFNVRFHDYVVLIEREPLLVLVQGKSGDGRNFVEIQ